jgi:hypothetical protein
MKKASLILIACMCLSAYPAIAYAEKDVAAPTTISAKSKKQLARELLVELGIGKQYDLFFGIVLILAFITSQKKDLRSGFSRLWFGL